METPHEASRVTSRELQVGALVAQGMSDREIAARLGISENTVKQHMRNLRLRLRLVAAGRTDREIGQELFISVRTVGNHVRNILNKTTTSNRTEAATYAGRHGLLS
jgi:NarL family two-component system response regulator LiaR